jgi:hypothetical protein
MADLAEKLSITTALPAGSQEPPPIIPPMTSSEAQLPPGEFVGSSRDLWMMAARAALGATFGFLTGMGLWNELYFQHYEFALVAIPLALAAYVLFDPIMKGVEGESEPTAKPRAIAALVAGAGASLVMALLHHSLDAALDLERLKNELGTVSLGNHPDLQVLKENLLLQAEKLSGFGGGLGVAIIAFVCIGVAALAVTRLWAHGARRQPPKAVHLGVASSLGVGIPIALLLVWYLASIGLLPSWQWKAVVGLLVVGWFLGPALSGGLGIQKYRSGSKPTLGILLYLIVFSVVYVLLLLGLLLLGVSARSGLWALMGLPILALILQNLGWALGLRRESCDEVLCGFGPQRTPAREARGLGLVVTMPRPDAVASDANPLAEAPPQDSLFNPKGDRLWATVALVLALIMSALAYYAGTLRRDPEIVLNIQNVFQQDSGLKGKPLKIHSDGKTVTLAGVVDNEAEHAKAVQEALKVRGVKQLIDQIQVTPSQPHTPIAPTPAEVIPSLEIAAPQPSINATISIGGSTGPGKGTSAASPKLPGSQKPAAIAKPGSSPGPVETPKTAEAPKHKGLLNFLKKDKNIQGTLADAKKPPDTSKTTDAEKHKGLFHFLKKDKDKNNENRNVTPISNNKNVTPTPNNQNDKNNKSNKKEVPKKPAAH